MILENYANGLKLLDCFSFMNDKTQGYRMEIIGHCTHGYNIWMYLWRFRSSNHEEKARYKGKCGGNSNTDDDWREGNKGK